MSDRVDVAIVGAGTAGLAALREVRKRTADFVLIDAPPHGTTCARVGCMPSKALIEAANAFHGRKGLEKLGIRGAAALSADLPAVLRRVRKLRDEFVKGVLESTNDLGPHCLAGRAKLEGPNRLAVGERVIEARQIVLAPGSSPLVPRPWRALGELVLTTDTLFEQESLPPQIGVIGLGPVGVEIAQALVRLGLGVHGFDGGDRLAGISDEKVADCLRGCLSEEFPIHLGAEVELKEADGAVAIERDGERVVVDRVIAAIGRLPNVRSLGLDSLGVSLDENGLPEIDPHTMRIGDTPVLLAGDANGAVPLLHEGADEGHIAGLNAVADAPIRLDRRTPMSVVFCDPEVAIVGERPDPDAALVGEAGFASQGRARIMQQNRGMLRVYAARADGRLLRAELAAPASEHMAHLLALAIGQGLTVFDMLRMPYYHPTLEEGLRSALRKIGAKLPATGLSDLASCGPLGVHALE